MFKIPATFEQTIFTLAKLNTNRRQNYARILQLFMF